MSGLENQYFPSWRLGYRSNPFRAVTPEEWREVAILPERLQAVIDNPPPLTQILGDQGRGKTSSLLALEHKLNQQGWRVAYEYLPLGSKHYKLDTSDIQIFLLDEAQRLSRRSLHRLISHASLTEDSGLRLILSSHSDLTYINAEHGITPVTFHLRDHPRSFINTLIEHRLKYFERKGHQGVSLTQDALNLLISHCDSDLRLLEKLLYETYQDWNEVGPITTGFIQGVIEGSN
jgi:hypothetical protein